MTIFEFLHPVLAGLLLSTASALATGRNYHVLGRVNYRVNNFRCPSEGFHPDPVDCRIFYRCVDWNSNVFFRDFTEPILAAFQLSCSEGTVFDPEFNVCNHPRDTTRKECGGRASGDPGNNQYPFTYPPAAGNGGGYPGESAYPAYPDPYDVSTGAYPNESENQISPEVDPFESSSDCSSDGFFPFPGDCKRFVRCTDNGMGGYRKFVFRCGEGTVWDQKNLVCNYPSAVPGCSGMGGNSQGGNQNGQYPGQGYPEQGNGPDDGQGGQYPGPGYPGQGNGPNRPDYPQGEGYPDQGQQPGFSESQLPSQMGYPQEGNYPNQGYPGDHNEPNQSGYPHDGQGSYPGQQPSFPQQGQLPSEMGYPQPGNQPVYPEGGSQVGQPEQGGNGPETSGYPQQGQPPQTSYPEHGNGPDQSGQSQGEGFPGSYPNQGGYPSEEGAYPEQGQGYPDNGDGNPMSNGNDCQGDGFFGVPGDCSKFFRCVDNGKGGYFKYDFVCGPGTVWDQESVTCNHPWAVQRDDCSTSATTESNSNASHSTSMQTTSNQNWGQSSSQQTTSSFSNFTQTSSSSSQSSSSSTSSAASTSQNQQSSSSQMTSSQLTTDQQSGFSGSGTNQESQTGMTTPMRPEYPTTARPNQPATPVGSRPCPPEKNTTIKCEKSGFYPVPGNCKKFYRCVDWDGEKGERFSVYYFECGDGTIWDPALETCNHEESVYPPRDCGGGGTGQNNETTSEENPATGFTTTESATAELTTSESTTSGETDPTVPGENTTSSRPETTPSNEAETTVPPPDEETTPNSDSTPFQTTSAGEANPTTSDSTNPTDPDSVTNPTSQKPNSSGGNPDCPELGEDQVAFVCPTGFRRHPKDCNLFYQCTFNKDGDVNVMTLSCKNDTVYDERKIQCLPPDETDPCPDKQGSRIRRGTEPEVKSAIPIPSTKSLCPREGHFPYPGDCQRFFKCEKDRKGRMQGYLYQCMAKYTFSEESQSCEKSPKWYKCPKTGTQLTQFELKWMTAKVPIEYVAAEDR